jgi:hypothetical protein
MSLCYRLFVTTQGCDDNEKAFGIKERLRALLAEWYARKEISGYGVVSAMEPQDYLDYELDRELIEPVTHGAFPFVWVDLTYEADAPPHRLLEALAREYNLLLLDSYTA